GRHPVTLQPQRGVAEDQPGASVVGVRPDDLAGGFERVVPVSLAESCHGARERLAGSLVIAEDLCEALLAHSRFNRLCRPHTSRDSPLIPAAADEAGAEAETDPAQHADQ